MAGLRKARVDGLLIKQAQQVMHLLPIQPGRETSAIRKAPAARQVAPVTLVQLKACLLYTSRVL